jgi:hypothetical protein
MLSVKFLKVTDAIRAEADSFTSPGLEAACGDKGVSFDTGRHEMIRFSDAEHIQYWSD